MVETGWRRDLRRKLIWLLAIKIAALALIGGLFFSSSQRPQIDPHGAAEHLGAER
jgi:hypothetical protein